MWGGTVVWVAVIADGYADEEALSGAAEGWAAAAVAVDDGCGVGWSAGGDAAAGGGGFAAEVFVAGYYEADEVGCRGGGWGGEG